jgi:hypothetical protein
LRARRAGNLVFVAVLLLVLVQPAGAVTDSTGKAPVIRSTMLCFCESAASKPTSAWTFAWLGGLSLLVIALAAAAASIMVVLLFRMMTKDSETMSG